MKNTEIWVFIFSLGLLSLNWPFLEIFYTSEVSYLFVTWILLIVLVALASRKDNNNKSSEA
ncbi:MAG TPA: hypothetical protein VEI28_04030 [Thermodesulfovibrionales bacterium]|nr:hypothetical protein [Thermodesulfovibrionales bacterium]